jgi:subtilisin family serine protease
MLRPRAPSFVALVLTTLVAASVTISSSAAPSGASSQSEATQPYIVVLEDSEGAISVASDHSEDYDVETKHVYSHALQGYSADLTAEQVAELEADDSVAYVDEDVVLHTQQDQPVPTGVQRVFGPENPHLGIGGPDDIRVDVDVAVIDTGVSNHSDLDVVDRVDCTGFFGGCSSGGNDDNGHGTHVAGSIGAINNGSGVVGVAPGARIWSQKVCGAGGSCTQSAIVGGIDYVAANADDIEVANMSLGGPGTNQPIAQAITAAVDQGVVFVVAAGNSNQDASGFQPANHPLVVTVSALADSDGQPGGVGGPPSCRPQSQDDHLADFSNWGSAVNIAAPGVCINSTWHDGGYNVISGTSMASPHGAGAAAVLTSGGCAGGRGQGRLQHGHGGKLQLPRQQLVLKRSQQRYR